MDMPEEEMRRHGQARSVTGELITYHRGTFRTKLRATKLVVMQRIIFFSFMEECIYITQTQVKDIYSRHCVIPLLFVSLQ
jgi:hypothetical protein